jgi:cell division inhibitor SulA
MKKITIRRLKNRVREKDAIFYRRFKNIIAPTSQLHHEWANNGTAEYTGVALVEADQHVHGFVDVIHVLRGGIILFTEASLQGRPEAIQW